MNQGLGLELVEGLQVFHDMQQDLGWFTEGYKRYPPETVAAPPPHGDILSFNQITIPQVGAAARLYLPKGRIDETQAWMVYQQQMVFQTEFGKMIE